MDGFAIDLDAVLDEFELREDEAAEAAAASERSRAECESRHTPFSLNTTDAGLTLVPSDSGLSVSCDLAHVEDYTIMDESLVGELDHASPAVVMSQECSASCSVSSPPSRRLGCTEPVPDLISTSVVGVDSTAASSDAAGEDCCYPSAVDSTAVEDAGKHAGQEVDDSDAKLAVRLVATDNCDTPGAVHCDNSENVRESTPSSLMASATYDASMGDSPVAGITGGYSVPSVECCTGTSRSEVASGDDAVPAGSQVEDRDHLGELAVSSSSSSDGVDGERVTKVSETDTVCSAPSLSATSSSIVVSATACASVPVGVPLDNASPPDGGNDLISARETSRNVEGKKPNSGDTQCPSCISDGAGENHHQQGSGEVSCSAVSNADSTSIPDHHADRRQKTEESGVVDRQVTGGENGELENCRTISGDLLSPSLDVYRIAFPSHEDSAELLGDEQACAAVTPVRLHVQDADTAIIQTPAAAVSQSGTTSESGSVAGDLSRHALCRPSSLDVAGRCVGTVPAGPPSQSTDEMASRSTAGDDVASSGGHIVTAPGLEQGARLTAAASNMTASGGAGGVRRQLASCSTDDDSLGRVAPVWVPDDQSDSCMSCEQRFTMVRRRHHCRACGRVLCATCCRQRAIIEYMQQREARVCDRCKRVLDRGGGCLSSPQHSAMRTSSSSSGPLSPPAPTLSPAPNPNNPTEYCSTVPPLQQQQRDSSSHALSVMVPCGVLRRSGEASTPRTPGGSKQVMFVDGIRPGGDLTESTGSATLPVSPTTPSCTPTAPHRRSARLGVGRARASTCSRAVLDAGSWSSDSGRLPPLITAHLPDTDTAGMQAAGVGAVSADDESSLVLFLLNNPGATCSFQLNANLIVTVQLVKLECCVGTLCWVLSSRGLCTVSQDEVMVVLQCSPSTTTDTHTDTHTDTVKYDTEERVLPRDLFGFYSRLHNEAATGSVVSELGHTLVTGEFLGSREHAGFLYVRPSLQCVNSLPVLRPPYLVALLIHRWEVPWAKVFPLRLMLRLGAEQRYYPCPLVSVRHRASVFFEIGHTIVNLLADFRNYAYVLPTISGMCIHMEERQTTVLLPRNRYNQVVKTLGNSDEHVLALGGSFSRSADSHLVCVQADNGDYHTQAINIQHRPRHVTGASFVVFNGALKASLGLTAKSSIVEDGLMFQISSDTMTSLRERLRRMQDVRVECGAVGGAVQETLVMQWTDNDCSQNVGVTSVIDGRSLDGVVSVRVRASTDYLCDNKLIRWTELFLIKAEDRCLSTSTSSSSTTQASSSSNTPSNIYDPGEFVRLAERLAQGTCVALVAQLHELSAHHVNSLALRATVDSDTVCYEAGSEGQQLAGSCLRLLDSQLVPVLHRYAAESTAADRHTVCLELLFHILTVPQ